MGAAHQGTGYRRRAIAVVAAANADPDTRCWRCRRTLAEHEPHATGRPAYWTAGHIVDGEIGGRLEPEASTCNFSAGGWRLVNHRRRRRQARVDDGSYLHW